MASAQTIINKALRLIGVLASSETPSAAEALDALESLNSLIDAYSSSPVYYYTNLDEAFPLVSGKSTYTIGVGGEFNTSRPIRVLAAFVRSGFMDTPLGLITEQYWTNIPDKSTTEAVAAKLLYRPNYPLGEIIVYPVPTSSSQMLHLKTEKTISQYPTLETDHPLPPGYRRLLELTLALDLATEYGTKVSEQTVAFLKADLESIGRINVQAPQTSKLQVVNRMDAAQAKLS